MRTIDRLLDLVRDMEGLSPIDRFILTERITKKPTKDETLAARVALQTDSVGMPWVNRREAPNV